MAHSPETKNAVRSSYVYEHLPLEAACEKHGVNYNTGRVWKTKAKSSGDDWDRARSAKRMASGGLGEVTSQIVEEFGLLFQTTINDIKDGEHSGLQKAEAISRLSDAYTKVMHAAAKGSPKLAKLAVAVEVLKLLRDFITDNYPDQMETFLAILDPFGTKLNEMFS